MDVVYWCYVNSLQALDSNMDGDEPKIFSLNSLNYLKLMKVWTVYLTAHHHLSTVALNVVDSTPP